MAVKVLLRNKSNKVKFGVLGFSWTTLFFGAFVSLYRKDFKIFIPICLIYIISLYYLPYAVITFDKFLYIGLLTMPGVFGSIYYFFINILGAFFYNYIYTQALVNRGFHPVSAEGKAMLQMYRISFRR